MGSSRGPEKGGWERQGTACRRLVSQNEALNPYANYTTTPTFSYTASFRPFLFRRLSMMRNWILRTREENGGERRAPASVSHRVDTVLLYRATPPNSPKIEFSSLISTLNGRVSQRSGLWCAGSRWGDALLRVFLRAIRPEEGAKVVCTWEEHLVRHALLRSHHPHAQRVAAHSHLSSFHAATSHDTRSRKRTSTSASERGSLGIA